MGTKENDLENFKEVIKDAPDEFKTDEFKMGGINTDDLVAKDKEDDDSKEEGSALDVLKEDLGKERDKFLRLFAEFENYKKRTTRERIELFKTANQEVVQALLPVLDDFNRANKEIQKLEDDSVYQGVSLIYAKLRETLRSKGLEEVVVLPGDSFDADLHEAITQVPAPEEALKGKIIDVIETGYKLGEKIIRFPKVVTGQ